MDASHVLRELGELAHNDIARLLMAASKSVNEAALAQIDPDGATGVRVAHIPVIAALEPEGSRLVDLAGRIGVTRQATAALVKDLVALGMVSVHSDPHDQRASRVHLTEAGLDLCERASELMRQRESEHRQTFGDEAIDVVKTVLRALARQ